MVPSYLRLKADELNKKIDELITRLESCVICPRNCRVNRLSGKKGFCNVGRFAKVSSYGPHFGEETVLVGSHGSGTIFFANCNLTCSFCQNYEISQLGLGSEMEREGLAQIMLKLKAAGCHNLNLVSATHIIPQVVEALPIAISQDFDLPIVYNSGGYDSTATLAILDDIIDIYMPDAKYGNQSLAEELSGVKDYVVINQSALMEMHRQVGDLVTNNDGLAERGMIIRHLVLPEGLACSEKVLEFIAKDISKDGYVNIMKQYHPAYLAFKNKRLSRRINDSEFKKVVDFAYSVGLHTGF